MVLLLAGSAWAAPPPGWFTPIGLGNPNPAFLSGTIKINGVPVPVNPGNMIAAFVPAFTNPIGLLADWSGQPAGQYALMEIDQSDGFGAQNGALPGDNVTFKFYSATLDRVLTAYTMQNVSDGVPYFLFPSNVSFMIEKTVNFDFQYDAPPVWSQVPLNGTTFQMYEGTTASGTLVATDPDNNPITYGITNKPAFCTIDSATGAYACTPGFAVAPFTDNICFTATSTGTSLVPQSAPPSCITLVVLDNNRAPVLTSVSPIDNVTLYANYTSTFAFTATDADNQALSWSLAPTTPGGIVPAFCSLSPTAGNAVTLSCTPTLADQGGSGAFRIVVTDGIDNTSKTLSGTVVNRNPVVTNPGPQTLSYAKTSATTVQIPVSDPDGNAVTVEVKLLKNSVAVTPAWFSVDNTVRPVAVTVNGPVPIQDNGVYTVSILATDNAVPPASPGVANASFPLNIALQVAWDSPINATYSIPEAGALVLNTKATDPLGGTVTYTVTGLPSFCSIDNLTRLVNCAPTYDNAGIYPMSFTASSGIYSTQMTTTLTVTNVNRAPVLTVDNATLQNLVLYAGVPVTRVFTASDLDNQTLTWLPDPNMPGFCSLAPLTGNTSTLTCLPTLAQQGGGSGSFNVTVTDGTDNAALTVSGSVVNRKPAIANPGTKTVSYLKATPTPIAISITDIDGNAIAASNATIAPAAAWFSYDAGTHTITVATPLTLAAVDNYVVTVTATDNGTPALAADNVAFALRIVQQISWDNTVPATVSVDEGATTTFPVKASDPLGGAVVYNIVGLPSFCADNEATGTVTCSPGFRDAGTYTVTSRATASSYWAQPDNVVTTLTVVNHSVPSFSAIVPADNVTGVVGTGAVAITKAFTVTDADPTETMHWTTKNLPSFCAFTTAVDNTRSRAISCAPTSTAQQGTYSGVSVTVSDGFDNVTHTFDITVDNRAPVVSLPAVTYVTFDNATATTIPLTVTDPDGNAVTVGVSIMPALPFAFDPATNVITIGTGLTAADVRSNYTITLTALDNGTPAMAATTGAGSTLTATVKVVYPRRFAPPAALPGTPVMTFSGTVGLMGSPAAFSDEVAAYSVHKVPGSSPVRWEAKLVGAGRIEDASGGLAPMSVLGDNPATEAVKEGCIPGEDVLLVLAHNLPGGGFQEYFAFDNGAGGPLSVAWNAAGGTADPNFIAGNRYPIRTGNWNLISYGVDSAWSASPTPPATALTGVTLNWTISPALSSAFPLASIAGKYDRILGNSGTGGTRMLVAGGASNLASLQPGLGYLIKARPSDQELAWMTVPGNPVPPALTVAVPQGYALLGFWGEGRRYRADGFNDNATLASLRTLVENGGAGTASISAGAGIGPVWSSITGRFDRTILYDAGGARIFIQSLPPQFNTMKYIAPGYGYWIKVTDPAGAPVGIGLLN